MSERKAKEDVEGFPDHSSDYAQWFKQKVEEAFTSEKPELSHQSVVRGVEAALGKRIAKR